MGQRQVPPARFGPPVCLQHPAECVLLVTHGLTIRGFVMRFLHLSIEEFDSLANPVNRAVVTLGERTTLESPVFTSRRWGVSGLTLRPPVA